MRELRTGHRVPGQDLLEVRLAAGSAEAMTCPACGDSISDGGDADHRLVEVRKGEFSIETCTRSQRRREAAPSIEKDVAALKERIDRAGIPATTKTG